LRQKLSEMVKPIVIYGSSVLRKKTGEIDAGDDFHLLASDMKETLKKAGGIGLAGPQVGFLKSIFVIDTTPLDDYEAGNIEKVYLNPKILNYSDDPVFFNEGCLSFPGIFEDINRPDKVEVRYRDMNFDRKEEVLEGIVARIYQHEYDHLQGVLFIDHLSSLRKNMLRRKLMQLAKKNL
jgi:peptide deformylase